MESTSNIHQLIDTQILHTRLGKGSPYLDRVLLPLGVLFPITITPGALGLNDEQRVRCAVWGLAKPWLLS
jgi:hypothetical protein